MPNIVIILHQNCDHLGYITETLQKPLVKVSLGSPQKLILCFFVENDR